MVPSSSAYSDREKNSEAIPPLVRIPQTDCHNFEAVTKDKANSGNDISLDDLDSPVNQVDFCEPILNVENEQNEIRSVNAEEFNSTLNS